MGGGSENAHRGNVHATPWQLPGYKGHQRTGQHELFGELRSVTMPINEQYCKRPLVEWSLLVELTRLRKNLLMEITQKASGRRKRQGFNAYHRHIHLPLTIMSVCLWRANDDGNKVTGGNVGVRPIAHHRGPLPSGWRDGRLRAGIIFSIMCAKLSRWSHRRLKAYIRIMRLR